MNEIHDPSTVSSVTSTTNDIDIILCESFSSCTSLPSTNSNPMDPTNSLTLPAFMPTKPSASSSNGGGGLVNPTCSASPPFSTAAPLPPISGDPVSSKQSRANARLESKCILALTNMATTLERYLLDELAVLDLIISTSRSMAHELRKIMTYQRELRSERCMFMFVTVLHQLASLLDIAARCASASTQHGKHNVDSIGSSSPPSSRSGVPADEADDAECLGPQFGKFGTWSVFNDEDQWSWRMYAISKECKNIGEMVAQLSVLANMGPKDVAGPPSSLPQLLESHCLFAGLLRKLKALGERTCSGGLAE